MKGMDSGSGRAPIPLVPWERRCSNTRRSRHLYDPHAGVESQLQRSFAAALAPSAV